MQESHLSEVLDNQIIHMKYKIRQIVYTNKKPYLEISEKNNSESDQKMIAQVEIKEKSESDQLR